MSGVEQNQVVKYIAQLVAQAAKGTYQTIIRKFV